MAGVKAAFALDGLGLGDPRAFAAVADQMSRLAVGSRMSPAGGEWDPMVERGRLRVRVSEFAVNADPAQLAGPIITIEDLDRRELLGGINLPQRPTPTLLIRAPNLKRPCRALARYRRCITAPLVAVLALVRRAERGPAMNAVEVAHGRTASLSLGRLPFGLALRVTRVARSGPTGT